MKDKTMQITTDLFINNEHRTGAAAMLSIVNPATEELVAEVRSASISQVDEAVRAAQNAFTSGVWRNPEVRKQALLKLADLVEAHRDELVDLLVSEIGTPINLKANHIDTPVSFLRWFANAGCKDHRRHLGLNASASAVSTVAYQPVGVVAAITAFNYPLIIGLTKMGAALATGCTVVLLSSPLAPLAVLRLGALVREAGIPAGVVNILAGGADVGRALTEHAGIDKVSFTGSVGVGREVMRQAAEGLRGVVLELGGKSAAIMLPKVDFAQYAFSLHARYARNAGQGCGSPTRILVEESRYEEFAEASRRAYADIRVGNPRDPSVVLGPVITAQQRERIESSVARAVQAGAHIIAGGGRPDIAKGWFVNPTLVGGLDNHAALAREEIFGPVSVVLTYRTVEEAVQIANDSDFGLKAYLFGERAQCLALAPELRVGNVTINGGSPLRPDAPMTGFKHSGVGSEFGEDGLREFMRPQHIDLALA